MTRHGGNILDVDMSRQATVHCDTLRVGVVAVEATTGQAPLPGHGSSATQGPSCHVAIRTTWTDLKDKEWMMDEGADEDRTVG